MQHKSKLRKAVVFPVACYYCNAVLGRDTHTWDHLVPKSKGGTYHESNLVHCCWPCNQAKADKGIGEFLLDTMHEPVPKPQVRERKVKLAKPKRRGPRPRREDFNDNDE